jgi:hypothetical protein
VLVPGLKPVREAARPPSSDVESKARITGGSNFIPPVTISVLSASP